MSFTDRLPEMFLLFFFIIAISVDVTVLLTSNTAEDCKKYNLKITTSFLNFRTALEVTNWALVKLCLTSTSLHSSSGLVWSFLSEQNNKINTRH